VSSRYCILLPANTPLFVHVRHAVDCFLPSNLSGKIVFKTLEGPGPNDQLLAQYLATQESCEIEGVKTPILAGICDPRMAANHDLPLVAAVVRRLAFSILAPRKLASGKLQPEQIKSIYAHGNRQTSAWNTFRPSSSAQALAKCIAQHINSRSRITIYGQEFDEEILSSGKHYLVVTANLSKALNTSSEDIQVYDAAELFPEWSPTLLSALTVTRQARNDDRAVLVNELIHAVQKACFNITTRLGVGGLSRLLLRYHSDQMIDESAANTVSRYLLSHRVIPDNIEVNHYGAALACSLWSYKRMAKCVLMEPSERFRMIGRPSLKGIRLPHIDDQKARQVKHQVRASSLDAHWQRRIKANLDVETADVLILTPTTEEFKAVLEQFPTGSRLDDITDETAMCECFIKLPAPALIRVVVACIRGMGRLAAATATWQLTARWRPNVLLLAGIAGGFQDRNVSLGDVIVTNYAIDYELQKINPKGAIQPDYRHFGFNKHLVKIASEIDERAFQKRIKMSRPNSSMPNESRIIHDDNKPCVLSGDKVIADIKALGTHRTHHRRAIGVEMEAAGVCAAVEALGQNKPKVYMIRAISDLADAKTKGATSKGRESRKNRSARLEKSKWREYACKVSGAFVAEFVDACVAKDVFSSAQES